jgi:TRAP-type C4-dicarboxylate transport system substrate-binding protein
MQLGETGVNAMGGSAVPMAYGELYTALQQGVLDGAENAAGNIFNDKFFEVSKFVSLTQHFRPPGVVVVSKKTWDKLTEQQKKVILKEGAALQSYEIDLTTKIVEDSLKQLEQKGMKINKVDNNSFATAVKPVYNGYISKFGKQDLDAILNTK